MFPDAVTRDLYYHEQAEAAYRPPFCFECGAECETAYVYDGSRDVAGCENCIDRHYTDDEGFYDFVCPNGCTLNPAFSEAVYTKNGEAIGCEHCINECEAEPPEEQEPHDYWEDL